MQDSCGRTIDYLRLSVTDRCNYRCRYCMPAEGVEKRAHGDILSLEELAEIAGAAVACGVKKIRLTGGEPLVRRGVVDLCRMLRAIPGVELPVAGPPQAGIVSFTLPPFHPYDVAVLLDQQGVAVRSGTHCAHPLFAALGMPQGVVRASLGLYNTLEDVERLCRALRRVAAIKL